MRALVTGAADGIGLALAERLARDGFEIVGVDVDADRARRVPGGRCHLCDLGDREALARLARELATEAPFDVVAHVAGISCVGRFETSDLAAQRAVVGVNLRAPLLLTPALLRAGRVHDGGSIVFVSSLSHQAGYPGAAVYAATKDGLASYARCLSVALVPRAICVTTVFPGPTRTAHARRYAPPGSREDKRMPPEQVADAIAHGIARRRRLVIPGVGNRIAARLGRIAPRVMDAVMRRVILDRLEPPRAR